MTSDPNPTFQGERTEQVNVQPTSRTEPPTIRRVEPTASPGGGAGTVLTSCILSLFMGAAGAWAYVEYLAPMLGKHHAAENEADAGKSGATAPATSDRLNEFGGKLDELQGRVDRLPKAVSPQDIEPIKEKIAVLEDVSRKVDALMLGSTRCPRRSTRTAARSPPWRPTWKV